MNRSISHLVAICSITLSLAGFSNPATAQELFFDAFEDRVADQKYIGRNWTWFEFTYEGDTCTGEPLTQNGPDGSDKLVENRNYQTASNAVGQGDSYFRAGLEVPAWDGALTNMMRVYGNQFIPATTCEQVLVFQEMPITDPGTFVFSFDNAQDRYGAPANGEIIGAFVKVIKTSDMTFENLFFEQMPVTPPVATTPENVTIVSKYMQFSIPEEWIGELLQFGFYSELSENLGQAWGTSAGMYDNVKLATLDIGPAHSGSFYNELQSGHGFSIEFGYLPDGSPFAIVYWYTFDSLGNPIFLVGTGTPEGNRVEITFDSPVGMVYGDFDPTSVTREDGGTAVFEFSDGDNATFSYTPSNFTMTNWGHTTAIVDLPLTKLFGIPADKFFEVQE